MFTYIENLVVGDCHDVIGKIRDITPCKGPEPYYRFTLYNDNTAQEFACVCKQWVLDDRDIQENDSIVASYIPLSKFMGMADCLLVHFIRKPVCGLTGNKNEDIIKLMEVTKKLIESEFKDDSLIHGRRGQVNRAYLKFRKAYLESRKKGARG